MKRLFLVLAASIAVLCMSPSAGLCEYHHGGESDSPKFLAVYPDKAGSKLDSCSSCHTGGLYE